MINKKKTKVPSKQKKKIIKKPKEFKSWHSGLIKIVLIGIFLFSLYATNITYSNTIHLLAVTENDKGENVGGSVIDLSLKIKPGSGQSFVNLNTIREVDTQISIVNSQKAACLIFELDCTKYDFFYDFDGSALILKGPSASAAIAILTAKTINRVNVDENIAITGSLSTGGLIGSVGGVEDKIQVAKNLGYKKTLVPFFSTYNESEGIEIVPVLDIISAYNEFGGDSYSLENNIIQSQEYTNTMQELSKNMCSRSNEIEQLINYSKINENSSLNQNIQTAQRSYNSSRISYSQDNYYSTGSFCYNSNINYRIVREIQKNLSKKEIINSIERLEKNIELKEKEIQNISNKSSSINDFYVTLLLFDRLSESEKLLQNSRESITGNNSNLQRGIVLYSQALERFNTVELWGLFIRNQKSSYSFDKRTINNACDKINKDITIKSKLLENQNINAFDTLLNDQRKYQNRNSNKYLCIYEGLELIGRIDTVLNSVRIDSNNTQEYIAEILDFTEKRISLNTNGDFPFIPNIYSEYSSDLFQNKDYNAALLYANYALAYSDLNLYLENKKEIVPKTRETFFELFENFWFVLGVLLLIGFV